MFCILHIGNKYLLKLVPKSILQYTYVEKRRLRAAAPPLPAIASFLCLLIYQLLNSPKTLLTVRTLPSRPSAF